MKYIWIDVLLQLIKCHAVVPRHGCHMQHTHRVQLCRDHATDAFSRSIPANQCRARLCDALTKNTCLITCLFAALSPLMLCLAAWTCYTRIVYISVATMRPMFSLATVPLGNAVRVCAMLLHRIHV